MSQNSIKLWCLWAVKKLKFVFNLKKSVGNSGKKKIFNFHMKVFIVNKDIKKQILNPKQIKMKEIFEKIWTFSRVFPLFHVHDKRCVKFI